MTGFAEAIIQSRRLFILRFLVENNAPLNEAVIHSTALRAGVGQPSRDDIRRDLDLLRQLGCVTEEWIDSLRIACVTERGEDVAYGRVQAEGVETSRWRR